MEGRSPITNKSSTGSALLRSRRDRNDVLTIFLGDEIFTGTRRTAISTLVFYRDFKLLGGFERELGLAAIGSRLSFRRFLHIFRREIDQLDLRNLCRARALRLHHFEKLERHRMGVPGIKKRFQHSLVALFESGFVFIDKGFFVGWAAGAERKGGK